MGKSRKSSEKQLKGMILSRFFLVLVIVSVVEFIVIALTNTYLIPNLIMVQKYGSLIRIDGAEGLFIIVFVLIRSKIKEGRHGTCGCGCGCSGCSSCTARKKEDEKG